MSDDPIKNFDCVKFTRDARRRVYEETKHMSNSELEDYWRQFRERDPLWQRWTRGGTASQPNRSDNN